MISFASARPRLPRMKKGFARSCSRPCAPVFKSPSAENTPQLHTGQDGHRSEGHRRKVQREATVSFAHNHWLDVEITHESPRFTVGASLLLLLLLSWPLLPLRLQASAPSSAYSARPWASLTPSPSRAFSAALLAARQILRLPLALRMLDPWSKRIHHALLLHVMCLFDTSLSSYVEFLLSSSRFSPTLSSCVLILSSSSRSSCAFSSSYRLSRVSFALLSSSRSSLSLLSSLSSRFLLSFSRFSTFSLFASFSCPVLLSTFALQLVPFLVAVLQPLLFGTGPRAVLLLPFSSSFWLLSLSLLRFVRV